MPSFPTRPKATFGVTAPISNRPTEEPSPMQRPQQVDVVSHDPATDRVVLSMIETRSWGENGALLPDLQEKLNGYLAYIEGGQLDRDHPQMTGKKATFRLHTQFPPTKREEDFFETAKAKYLDPRGIVWLVTGFGSAAKKA
jgi:hypothetical protein